MKSVLQSIQDLDVRYWYYYFQKSRNELENPFNNNITHLEFIKKYFRRSGKEKVLQKFDVNNFLPENAPHTNSVFFIGSFIYYNTIFKDYIDNSLTVQGYNMFPFVWFLVTLFHDFGYKYENRFDQYKHIVDIETLRKKLNIRYDLLKYKRIQGVSHPLYKNIRNYFLYRRFNSKHRNKIDHGILAGLFFYDALVRNRIEQYNKKKNDELYFGPELNKVYAQAAAVIATHNIWLPSNDHISEYKKFGLDELINMRPVSMIESPLLILLGIIDTIDPVKICSKKDSNIVDCNNILNDILISCKKNRIVLRMSRNSKLDFGKITDRTNWLKGWLDVSVEVSKDQLAVNLIG